MVDPLFSDVKKNWILAVQKFFVDNHQFDCDLNYSFFQQKFGHSRVRILFYTIIPLNLTLLFTAQSLTSNLKFLKLIFSLNLKLRYAVEISHQKILIFEKFESSTFTGKKNQGFWTRIDNFRNSFKTLAYPDVTWTVSLIPPLTISKFSLSRGGY